MLEESICSKLQEFYAPSGKERVGFILKSGEIIEALNEHPDAYTGFEVDMEDFLEKEPEIWATFHTHPGGPANLSMDDYTAFKNWPNWLHLVVGHDGIKVYKVDNGVVLNVGDDQVLRAPSVYLRDDADI